MKYIMIDGYAEPSVLAKEPTVEEVQGNDDFCFLSIEIVRGDEIVVRKAIVNEAEDDDSEDELDWEKLS